MGLDVTALHFSWNCVDGLRQSAFRVLVQSTEGKLLWDSGKVSGSSMRVKYGGAPLASRTQAVWKVMLWAENGYPGPWSGEAPFELGLLRSDDWQAKWIDPELPHDPKERQRASYLKRTFSIAEGKSARLYITAHGIYDAYLNGRHVDGYLLAPGTSQYPKRLQVQTYDVTELLHQGQNELLVTLGDGWYRGSVAFDMDVNTFGTDVVLLAQLEVGGIVAACTDADWEASQEGPLGCNDLMKGEVYDAARSPIRGWHGVTVRDWGLENLIGTDTVPVTAHERFLAKLLHTPGGETVLDFGQVIAGYVEWEITACAGQKLILTHGETLDENGNFTISNFQNPRKPYCLQRVVYTCREGVNRYHPTKCYFGFRYVKVEGDVKVTGSEFTAVAVYSDLEQTGWFSCGNEEVNQLFHNALWSMKGNFVDIPTDCPTREKSGYSGDCQVFCHTAMYLMDCWPVLRRWTFEQAATQFEDGCVRQIAPDNRRRSLWDGGAGWCDSMEIVPWRLARRYGDDSILEEHYETIRRWMLFCLRRAKKTRLRHLLLPKKIRDYVVDTGIHWGEWEEPGTSPVRQIFYMADIFLNGAPETATAYLRCGCAIVSEIAARLGKKEDAAFFAAAAKQAKAAYRRLFLPKGRVKRKKRQCLSVRPLALDLFEPAEKAPAARVLAEKIRENGNRLNTGFLTTHELCRVLTDCGQGKTAYDLLLQTKRPSWLYAVRKGATTMWESWDGVNEEGKVFNSFNHYAYGAIAGWLFDRVLGIVVEDGAIRIQPYPDPRLGHAQGLYRSPLGTIRSAWKYEGDRIRFSISIPVNAEAKIVLPGEAPRRVSAGEYSFTQKIQEEGTT
ncbi:MAG: family 78 glycoside hydrolase catalytic domain [Lachnospiraceae bacterium]